MEFIDKLGLDSFKKFMVMTEKHLPTLTNAYHFERYVKRCYTTFKKDERLLYLLSYCDLKRLNAETAKKVMHDETFENQTKHTYRSFYYKDLIPEPSYLFDNFSEVLFPQPEGKIPELGDEDVPTKAVFIPNESDHAECIESDRGYQSDLRQIEIKKKSLAQYL